MGNRLARLITTSGSTTTDTYSYPATSNRLQSVSGGQTRSFTYDAAGNVTYDARSGVGYGYTYNAANRMESFSINGVVQAEYQYNARGQQVIRRLTQTGQTIHSIYDTFGNRIAEYEYDDVSGSSTLLREYVWMDDQAVAVIEGGEVYYVRSDHIGRPVFATDDTGTIVWEAEYLPFGGVHVSTGSNINLRFPGQWFQSESGLHQNWMRDYDPTTGRYIQADPLGLVDGPSVYGYALQNPGRYTDPTGLFCLPCAIPPLAGAGGGSGSTAAGLLGGAGLLGMSTLSGDTPRDGANNPDNIIPFPQSPSLPDDIVGDGCGGGDDCPARLKALLFQYSVYESAIEMGVRPDAGKLSRYLNQARKYNAECVPKGWPAAPTSFIKGVK